jgi:hypothetical protein
MGETCVLVSKIIRKQVRIVDVDLIWIPVPHLGVVLYELLWDCGGDPSELSFGSVPILGGSI